MTKIIGIREPWAITIRKKFGLAVYAENGGLYAESGFGEGIYGAGEAVPASQFHGVYQMRRCAEGYIPVQMKFYKPTNPRTILQQSNRDKVRIAVIAWKELTESEKKNFMACTQVH